MLGKPKYKLGDMVKFLWGTELKTGEIYIVDKYGTFDDASDVSYDIMDYDARMLYKHIQEKYVVKKCRYGNYRKNDV